jgi:hypothetical protein
MQSVGSPGSAGPRKPGYYWARWTRGGQGAPPEIVRVCDVEGSDRVKVFGDEVYFLEDDFTFMSRRLRAPEPTGA